MNIIQMNDSHIYELEQIEKMCFSTPWTSKQLSEELDNKNSLFLVAEENGKTVGYIGCQITIDGGYITNVAVHKDYRRQGIAFMLVSELNKQCKAKKLEFVTLEVRITNNAAKSLYEKMVTFATYQPLKPPTVSRFIQEVI